jgi:hypothetical protein
MTAAGGVVQVNLSEKLLVTALSKLSNFVPGAGIWLNTQRPEWNDANNALVGYAASMVTLYHLRRYLNHCSTLFGTLGKSDVSLSKEVADWLSGVETVFQKNEALLSRGEATDADRKSVLDGVGAAFGKYREAVYENGFSGKTQLSAESLQHFCQFMLRFVDHSIRSAKRENGLYDAYNLISVKADGIGVRRLYDMLEGQVSALSAGLFDSTQVLDLVSRMEQSGLYRPDQHSYLLYPNRPLASYFERNRISAELVKANPLLATLADSASTIVVKDARGDYRFDSGFTNAKDLAQALDALKADAKFGPLVAAHRAPALDVYEKVFEHAEFTGRSGTMYGYEGLGCIYWHMVSKLMLAVEECALGALEDPKAPM